MASTSFDIVNDKSWFKNSFNELFSSVPVHAKVALTLTHRCSVRKRNL